MGPALTQHTQIFTDVDISEKAAHNVRGGGGVAANTPPAAARAEHQQLKRQRQDIPRPKPFRHAGAMVSHLAQTYFFKLLLKVTPVTLYKRGLKAALFTCD